MNNYFIVLFLGVLLLSAGCIGGDYVPNRDIVVIKLSPEGSQEWTRLIDTGFDDSAEGIIETSDGGYIIAAANTSQRIGGTQSRLIRMSGDGSVIWDRILNGTGSLTSVIQTRDGGFAALSDNGVMWRTGPDGTVLWSRSLAEENEQCHFLPGVHSVAETYEGGFIVPGGAFRPDNEGSGRCELRVLEIIKLDRDGNKSSIRTYEETGIQAVTSIHEISPDRGYIVSASGYFGGSGNISSGNVPVYALLLRPNGSVVHVTQLGETSHFNQAPLKADNNGYKVIFVDDTVRNGHFRNIPVEVSLDPSGAITRTRSINAPSVITWTGDGGFISAGFPVMQAANGYSTSSQDESRYGGDGWSHLHAMRYSGDLKMSWDRDLGAEGITYVKKVIATSDGGFVILGMKENR